MSEIVINSEEQKRAFIASLEKQWLGHRHITIKMRTGKQRTPTQNASMHKYFTLLSDALNDAGYTVAKTFKKPIDMSWTAGLVKDLLWRKIQVALLDKESTTKLERSECSTVYDELNKIMIDNYGISVSWPQK